MKKMNERKNCFYEAAVDQYPEIAECMKAVRRMNWRNFSLLANEIRGR